MLTVVLVSVVDSELDSLGAVVSVLESDPADEPEPLVSAVLVLVVGATVVTSSVVTLGDVVGLAVSPDDDEPAFAVSSSPHPAASSNNAVHRFTMRGSVAASHAVGHAKHELLD